jgi:hypothetical protein
MYSVSSNEVLLNWYAVIQQTLMYNKPKLNWRLCKQKTNGRVSGVATFFDARGQQSQRPPMTGITNFGKITFIEFNFVSIF